MNKTLCIAALIGFVSVTLGAMQDHYFEITEENADSMQTAIRYSMLYAVLIAAISLSAQKHFYIMPIGFFITGSIIFSGSIYLSVLLEIEKLTYLTPLGGICIMLGWLSLAFKAISSAKLQAANTPE